MLLAYQQISNRDNFSGYPYSQNNTDTGPKGPEE